MALDASGRGGRWTSDSGAGLGMDVARQSPRSSGGGGGTAGGPAVGSARRPAARTCEEVSRQRKAVTQVKDLDPAELLGRLAGRQEPGGQQCSPSAAPPASPASARRALRSPPPQQQQQQQQQLLAGTEPGASPTSPLHHHRRTSHSWNGAAAATDAFPPPGAAALLTPPRPSLTGSHLPQGITLLTSHPMDTLPWGPTTPSSSSKPPERCPVIKALCDRSSAQASHLLPLLDPSSAPPTRPSKPQLETSRPSPLRLPHSSSMTRQPPASPTHCRTPTRTDVSADIASFLRFHPGEKAAFGGQLAVDAKQALARRYALTVDAEEEAAPRWLLAAGLTSPPLQPQASPRALSSQDSTKARVASPRPSDGPSAAPSPHSSTRGGGVAAPLPRLPSRSGNSPGVTEMAELGAEALHALQAALLQPREPKAEHPGADPSCRWRFNPQAADISGSVPYMYVYKRSNSRQTAGIPQPAAGQ